MADKQTVLNWLEENKTLPAKVTVERVVERPEPRRVLWLITDGQPYYTRNDLSHDDDMQMEQIHAKCKRTGVETIGMFVGHGENPLESFTDKTFQITQASELPSAIMQITREIAR